MSNANLTLYIFLLLMVHNVDDDVDYTGIYRPQHIMGMNWVHHFASAVQLFSLYERETGKKLLSEEPQLNLENPNFFQFLKEV